MGKQFIWNDLSVKGALSAQSIKLRVLSDGGVTQGQFVEMTSSSTATEFRVADAGSFNLSRIVGFATNDIADGEWGEITIKGIVSFTAPTNTTMAVGDKLYYDYSSGEQYIGNAPNEGNSTIHDAIPIGTSNTAVTGGTNLEIALDMTSNQIFSYVPGAGVDMVADSNGISYKLNIEGLTTAAIDNADYIAFSDSDDSNNPKSITVANLITYLETNMTLASTLVGLDDVTGPITSNSIMIGNSAGDNMGFIQGGANQVLMTNALSVPTFTSLSTAVDLGAASPSDVIISSQAAIKTYVDNMFSTQVLRVTSVDLLVYELSDANVGNAVTTAPAGTAVIWANGPSLYYAVSDGSTWGAGKNTPALTRVILMDATARGTITVDVETDNAIYSVSGLNLTLETDPAEGMITFVDQITATGDTDGTGKDAIFIDDGGVFTGWELRNIAVSSHTQLINKQSYDTIVNDDLNLVTPINDVESHLLKGSITALAINSSKTFTIPVDCTISYLINVNGAKRVGSLQISGTDISETSNSGVGTDEITFTLASGALTVVSSAAETNTADIMISVTDLTSI